MKFDHTSATTQGKAGVINKDIKTTNNVSTGTSEISTDLQINAPQVNSNLEIAPSSVTSGGSFSILPGTSIGASVTISHSDVLNSDISVNFGQNVRNNTTNTLSVGIKPIGIIMVVAAVVADRFLPPITIGGLQPQINTVIVPPSN